MYLVNEMIHPVITPLRPEMNLSQAVDLILDADMTGLPVVDDHLHVVGFLSEHDCIPFLIKGSYHCDSRALVADMMHKQPLTVSPGDSIIDLAQMMMGAKPKVYPVIREGVLLGVITRGHIMRELNHALKTCKTVA
ncbi:CBS domain-containing protein [Marinobacterium jannaschii]|uniref:CBS domain-containing protein n=1 Tax=Marinobacterium jannaschii TaxID=64970 RepID=UPI0004850ACF|nr:CBS domain-containing protein [Marinobacterium jannaschii]